MAKYFFGITDKGRQREKNEDTFFATELEGKRFAVACVIDGVGGYSGGDVAASIARKELLEQLQHMKADHVTDHMKKAIIAANARILEAKKLAPDKDQMACVLTCVVTDLGSNSLFYAHVGDTRLYLLRDHSLVKLTTDHSVIGYLEESGRLSEEEAMRHPKRNEINKALGFEEIATDADFIESGESPFLPGDTLLVCSDGLTDMLPTAVIANIIQKNKQLENGARQLVDAANEAGGHDNITVILLKNRNLPVATVATKPVERTHSTEKPALHVVKGNQQNDNKKPVKKHNNTLSYLAILVMGIFLVLLFQNSSRSTGNTNRRQPVLMPAKSEYAIQLTKAATDNSTRYTFPITGTGVNLTETIRISKDSFYIDGHGTVITADSSMRGAGFIISGSSKYVVLDSLVFKNMNVAIIAENNNLVLKNVRFVNCRVPLQYAIPLGDTIISGRIADSIFVPVIKSKQH